VVGSTLAPEKYIVVAKVDPVNMKLGDEVEIRTFFTHNCSNVLTNICWSEAMEHFASVGKKQIENKINS